MMPVTLYKRDARNNILRWQINQLADGTISIAHGIFAHKPHVEFINPTMKKANEVQSRINAKRKEGYKAIEDLWDNAPSKIFDDQHTYEYLKAYLPKYNTTSEGFVLPMLAKTLEDNKPFEKCGTMLGQYKINGLRCIVGAEKVIGDLFNSYRLTYTSREGTRWNLEWMDEIISSNLSDDMIDMMIEEGVCLDGELYLPGYSVNDINSFVKNNTLPQHYQLQYWCYDLTMEAITAYTRHEELEKAIKGGITKFVSKAEHLDNKKQFLVIPSYDINNITAATISRNLFIDLGFEGLIVRNPEAEYAFGKRNSSMFKYKKKLDGKFMIVDIQEDKRGLPIFTLKNDINDETFECTINLPHIEQKPMLSNKAYIISNNLAVVEYRERSGKAFVPFHAKIVKLLKN